MYRCEGLKSSQPTYYKKKNAEAGGKNREGIGRWISPITGRRIITKRIKGETHPHRPGKNLYLMAFARRNKSCVTGETAEVGSKKKEKGPSQIKTRSLKVSKMMGKNP